MLTETSSAEVERSSQRRVVDWITSYGVRIGLQTNKSQGLELFRDYLPPLWRPSSSNVADLFFSLRIGKSKHELFEDNTLIISSRSLKRVLETFRFRLKAYIAEMARRRVFVHAGAVGWQGKAIIIPGRSMSGKTSLVKELVQAGATYYSDEYAVLDTRGFVHAYPQPLAIRKAGSFVQKNRRVEDLGGVSGDTPLPIALVIISRYQPEARWRPKRLSSGQGVLELLAHTVPARRKPETVMPTLQRALSQAMVLKSPRGEAEQTIDLILRRYKAP